VQLSDGRTKKAQLVGADSQLDLAVLKIDDPGVKPLKLADSDTVQPGDFVLAIGNPFGLQETVTDGIISWKGRPNSTDFRGDLLQTNAAINPGNSGGKLSALTNKSFPAVAVRRESALRFHPTQSAPRWKAY
jgi:S1-C subfamily serine protease